MLKELPVVSSMGLELLLERQQRWALAVKFQVAASLARTSSLWCSRHSQKFDTAE